MTKYDCFYRCPECRGRKIIFLEFYPKSKTLSFWCKDCDEEFQIKDDSLPDIYEKDLLKLLEKKYPVPIPILR